MQCEPSLKKNNEEEMDDGAESGRAENTGAVMA